VVPTIITALKDPELMENALECIMRLAEIGASHRRLPSSFCSKAIIAELRAELLPAVSLIISALKDSDSTVRRAALEGIARLATMGTSAPCPPLRHAQVNSQPTQRHTWK
jgi:HEAT repeat protein